MPMPMQLGFSVPQLLKRNRHGCAAILQCGWSHILLGKPRALIATRLEDAIDCSFMLNCPGQGRGRDLNEDERARRSAPTGLGLGVGNGLRDKLGDADGVGEGEAAVKEQHVPLHQ